MDFLDGEIGYRDYSYLVCEELLGLETELTC